MTKQLPLLGNGLHIQQSNGVFNVGWATQQWVSMLSVQSVSKGIREKGYCAELRWHGPAELVRVNYRPILSSEGVPHTKKTAYVCKLISVKRKKNWSRVPDGGLIQDRLPDWPSWDNFDFDVCRIQLWSGSLFEWGNRRCELVSSELMWGRHEVGPRGRECLALEGVTREKVQTR
jgi:hypothetical protein